jgi:hypothetical protein
MKTGPDVLATAENEYGDTKHENGTRRPPYCRKRVRERKAWKRDPTPSLPPKTCTGTQNMKTGPDALGTAENEYEDAKHENGARSAKHENGTRRPPYRRKRVRERKMKKQVPTPMLSAKMSTGTQNMKMGPNENEYGDAKHENET